MRRTIKQGNFKSIESFN